MLPISMGNSDFKEIREEGFYYVDKSLMIREILQDQAKVVLLPRPRRFGKTLNLNMCEAFFSDREPNRKLFDGLAIANDPEAMKHHGGYPTINLTFKDLHADTWENCQAKLRLIISKMFHRFEKRINPSPFQQRFVSELLQGTASLAQLEESLSLLTQLLHDENNKKVFVFVDEYDAPIQDGYFFGYYDKIVSFMRSFLGSVLKDNTCLRKGVLTGVLRIAQESLFSGLNNIQVYTVLDQGYATCFGFTEPEVEKILEECQMLGQIADVKRWYNGYKIGAKTVYNPWSILSVAANPQNKLNSYWINTAQDKLIENLITKERCLSLADLTALLKGESLIKEIRASVALSRIDGQSIWSLLLFSGYLTVSGQKSETLFALKLPNREVRTYFEQIVRRWFSGSDSDLDPLQSILVRGDLSLFKTFIQDRVLRLVGQNDTGGRSAPENFYHGLILGLVAYRLDETYVITSNRESGLGRYDVQLCPRQPGLPGYIFEFKSLKSESEQDLKDAATLALAQIQKKKYAHELQVQGVAPIWLVGVGFHGKQLEMVWAENASLPALEYEPMILPNKSLDLNQDVECGLCSESSESRPERGYAPTLSSLDQALENTFSLLVAQVEAHFRVTGADVASQDNLSKNNTRTVENLNYQLWLKFMEMGNITLRIADQLVDLDMRMRQLVQALNSYQDALKISAELVEKNSCNRVFLIVSLGKSASLLLRLKRIEESDAIFRQALGYLEQILGTLSEKKTEELVLIEEASMEELARKIQSHIDRPMGRPK